MTGETSLESSIFRQICGALAVNVLSLCNGLSASWTSPIEPILEAANNPIRAEPITKEEFSWPTSALYLGGLVGIFIWNNIADKFGRKINGYGLALTQITGWLGIIIATSPMHLTISRFIMGLGGAGIITSSQLYINETANASIKGPLCSLLVVAMQLGSLLVFIMGALLPYVILNYACLSVPIIFALLFYTLPESPLYLLMQHKQTEAKEALLWFNYGNVDAAEVKMQALTQSMNEKMEPALLGELLASRQSIRTMFTAIIMLTGHQLSGYSFISSYTVEIFKMSKTKISPHKSSILVCLIQFITASIIGYVAKYMPKRRVMLLSYMGACLSLACLSLFLYGDGAGAGSDTGGITHFTWIPTLSLVVYIMCYSAGIGPVSYMLITEMFPARILNNAISVALTVSILFAFSTVKIFPWLLAMVGKHGTFLLYALNNAILTLFVFKFVLRSKFQFEPPAKSYSPKIKCDAVTIN